MPEGEQSSAGILASVRRLTDAFLSTVQNRVELFALELQEEKCWLVATLLWAAAMIFFGGLAIIFIAATIIFVAPENARPWLLGIFSAIFLYLGVNAFVGLRRSLRDKPPALADTVGELKKDIAWIRSQD